MRQFDQKTLLFVSFAVVACCILLLCTACSRPISKTELVVGMDLSYPPFETIQPNGVPTGISVEIAQHLGAYLDRPVRIENIPFIGLIPSLRTNKVDLVISSMTDTPERRKSIAFSDPYLTIGLACLVQKNAGIQDAKDLNTPNRKVAVRQGTTAQLWVAKNLSQANIIVLEKESEAVLEVVQGKVDAFIYDQMSVWRYAQIHQETCEAILTPLSREHWAIGLRLCDTVLTNQVNAFLKEFRMKGGFEKLGDQYLGEQKRTFRQLGIPFYF
jgi:polar amino acid transport system substrate-binding protein